MGYLKYYTILFLQKQAKIGETNGQFVEKLQLNASIIKWFELIKVVLDVFPNKRNGVKFHGITFWHFK